jgi:hypothetical protein
VKLIGVTIAKPELNPIIELLVGQRVCQLRWIVSAAADQSNLKAAELGFWRTVLAIGRHLLKSAG